MNSKDQRQNGENGVRLMGFNIDSAPSLKRWKNRAWGVKGIRNWELMEGNLIDFNNRRSHFVTFIWFEQQSYFDNLCQLMTCPTLHWDCSGVSQWRMQNAGIRDTNMWQRGGLSEKTTKGPYRSISWRNWGWWENNWEGGRLVFPFTAVLNRATTNTVLLNHEISREPVVHFNKRT